MEGNREPSQADPPDRAHQLVLNLGSGGADTEFMGSSVDNGPAGTGTRGLYGRPRHRANTSAELRTLRERLALVSMQKDYWWQRYTESTDECTALRDEVLELRKALAQSRSGPVAGDAGHPRRTYVDRRLLS